MAERCLYQAFYGVVVHSASLTDLEILPEALLVIDASGRITSLEANVPKSHIPQRLSSLTGSSCSVTELSRGQFIMPGFVDTHHHAPQWLHRGQGQGLHILEWLDQVAFPTNLGLRTHLTHGESTARSSQACCDRESPRRATTARSTAQPPRSWPTSASSVASEPSWANAT